MLDLKKLTTPEALISTPNGAAEALVNYFHQYVTNHPRYVHERPWNSSIADQPRFAKNPLTNIDQISMHYERDLTKSCRHISLRAGMINERRYLKITFVGAFGHWGERPDHRRPGKTRPDIRGIMANDLGKLELMIDSMPIPLENIQEMARRFGDVGLDWMTGKNTSAERIRLMAGFVPWVAPWN
jgi:hypothetical protein